MKKFQIIMVVCIAFVLASCAATRPPLPEVKLPPEPISQNGYSVIPLNENGWMIIGRDKYEFALIKPGENLDETFVIQGMRSKLKAFKSSADFVRQVKEDQAKDTNPQRYKTLKHEVTSFPMKGVTCAKSHMVAEDNAAKKRSSITDDMILEMLMLSCSHPSEKDVGINVVYSHRHYPGQEDADFIKKGESVLNSVKLFEPEVPFISPFMKESHATATKFSKRCSTIIGESSLTPAKNNLEADSHPLEKLSSMGITIERGSNDNQVGSYALFEKGQEGSYSLVEIQPNYIEPTNKEIQEVLFVSPQLDKIAPAFARQVYSKDRKAFQCESGLSIVTGIDSSYRSSYNPCDSSLTSASNIGTAVMANTFLTVLSLGTNVISGSSVTFVDTNKEKVAKLVTNSKLFKCLQQEKSNGLALN